MLRRVLGKTGLEVGVLGFGGLFASRLGPGFEDSRAAVRRAIELGINYIDTAPAYADSEVVLGRILGDIHEPLIVSTKLGGRPLPFDPQDKIALIRSAEESLRTLGRDVIDILFIHEPDRPLQYNWWSDPTRAHGSVVEALDDLRRRGVVRYTGLAGTTATELAHFVHSGQFDVVLTAFNYSPLFREAGREVLPAAREKQMGVVLGSVLHQGALGRRYDEAVRRKPAWLSAARREQLLGFYAFLDELGMPIVELGLRFALSVPEAAVLIGPKTARHVEEAVAAVEKGPLPVDVIARLDQLAAMLPCRPFEEPMILPLSQPTVYFGPGPANLGVGVKVGALNAAKDGGEV
jgi:aryl-alcohol dehydrogenase-like predicted oxidoreductase